MESLPQESKPLPYGIEKLTDIYKGRVYFAGSIRGAPVDPLIGYKLVGHMLENGAEVPSAHVAARSQQEMDDTFFLMSGKEASEIIGNKPEIIFETDIGWVQSATHMVALIDSPSHGVGEEIMYALLKPQLGFNHTPILCLVSKENAHKVSLMIKGSNVMFGNTITLYEYESVEDAQNAIHNFLLKQSNEA